MTTTKTKTNTKNQKLESIEIVFHPPKTPKFNVIFNPERCVVKKDKPVEIIVSLVVNMTTETEIATGIEVPELKVHSFLIQRISSELSPLIDIDEVRTDNTKIVGDGAYGTVYRGEYRGQDVAVKILKIQDLPEDMLDEFDREIDLMTKLRHKNIVQFVGASKVVGKLAIVTEFIEGGNVTNLLKEPISFALKLKIALDTARALNFLQQNKILHRDLKPDNLLVVSKSTDPLSITVKLADFGTSRAVSEKLANKYTMGIGTPIYMAPEILAKKQYDLKADIYSFGMILWVLYTQQEPYTFLENSWDVAKFVLDGHREKIPQDCPNDYRKLIERCWDGDPNNRPSCEEIISQLEQMLRAELNKTQKNQPINFIPDPNVYVRMQDDD
jgi:serine/threonine protein kinase